MWKDFMEKERSPEIPSFNHSSQTRLVSKKIILGILALAELGIHLTARMEA